MKMMQIDELRAGDVLLCYKDEKFDIVGKGITHVTGSEYTHAAICIDFLHCCRVKNWQRRR